MEEIKKCPFCGGSAEVSGFKRMKVICSKCGASSPTFDLKSAAISSWNSRKVDDIVYCNDCVHYHEKEKWCDEHSHLDTEKNHFNTVNPDEYCSRGERR